MMIQDDPVQLAATRCLDITEACRRHLYRHLYRARCEPLDRVAFLRNVPANVTYMAVPRWLLYLILFTAAFSSANDVTDNGSIDKLIGSSTASVVAYLLLPLGLTFTFKLTGKFSLGCFYVGWSLLAGLVTWLLQLNKFHVGVIGLTVLPIPAWFWIQHCFWTGPRTASRSRPWGPRNRYLWHLALMLVSVPFFALLIWIDRRYRRDPPDNTTCSTPGCPMLRRELPVLCRSCDDKAKEVVARAVADARTVGRTIDLDEQERIRSAQPEGFVHIDTAIDRPFVSRCPVCAHDHPVWDPVAVKNRVWLHITQCDTPTGRCTQNDGNKAIQIVRVGKADIRSVIDQIAGWANGTGAPPKAPTNILPLRLAGHDSRPESSLTLYIHDRPQSLLHATIPVLIVLPKLGILEGHETPGLRSAVNNLVFSGPSAPIWFWWREEFGALPGDNGFDLLTDARRLDIMLGSPGLWILDAGWKEARVRPGGVP